MRTVMITAFDGVSYGDCETPQFLALGFYTAENRARMVQEYADFTFELYRRYAGTGKTFLITNWESDNAVYCGSSYEYSRNAEFRRHCTDAYPTIYGGNTSPSESLQALRQWFEVRWEGMQEGRRRTADLNIGGVAVYMGPEINSLRDLSAAGYPSVLTRVIPVVNFDFVSYSSWETLNGPEPVAQLKTDIEAIRKLAGTPDVVIGELGYATAHWGSNTVRKIDDAIKAAAEVRVQYVFQWMLYEDATNTGYGLFDESGNRTALASDFHAQYTQPQNGRNSTSTTGAQ